MQAGKSAETILKNMHKKVAELKLSVRSTNCLRKANIVYVGDLVQMTENDLLCLRNFGLKSLREIKTILAEMGFELGMPPSATKQKDSYQTAMGAKLTMPHPEKESEASYQTILGIELIQPHREKERKGSYQKKIGHLNQDIFIKYLRTKFNKTKVVR